MARVEPSEGHGEVEAQPKIGELERIDGGREVFGRQTALHHRIGELLVVSAEAGVQALTVFDNGRLDLVETVRPIAGTDDTQDALTLSLLGRQEVAHPARRIHG